MTAIVDTGRTIIRAAHNRENPYVMIRRAIFHGETRVKNLFDKGLMGYLLSLPDNWKISVEHLASENECNKETISKSLNRLIAQGYIIRNKVAGTRGQFGGYEYLVYEEPVFSKNDALPTANFSNSESIGTKGSSPYPVLPDTVSPCTVEPSLLSNDYNNKDIYNPANEISDTPEAEKILNADELLKIWQPELETVNTSLKMGGHKPLTQPELNQVLIDFNALYLGKTYNPSFKLRKLIAWVASTQINSKTKKNSSRRSYSKADQSATPIEDRFAQHKSRVLTEDEQLEAQRKIQEMTQDTPF